RRRRGRGATRRRSRAGPGRPVPQSPSWSHGRGSARENGRVGSDSRREALVRARLDAAEQVATLTHHLRGVIDASRFTNADDEHDPEGSTIAFERAQLTALLMAARRRLADLDEVL